MTKQLWTPDLPQLHIPNPCPMSWNEMQGDERRRYCRQCDKFVFNFGELTSREISDVLQSAQPICAQIQQYPNGSILTKDRLSTRRAWFGRFAAAAASLFGLLTLTGCDREKWRNLKEYFFPSENVAPENKAGMLEIRALGHVSIEQPLEDDRPTSPT